MRHPNSNWIDLSSYDRASVRCLLVTAARRVVRKEAWPDRARSNAPATDSARHLAEPAKWRAKSRTPSADPPPGRVTGQATGSAWLPMALRGRARQSAAHRT